VRALVTGAASGIGRATCLRLARDAQTAGRKAQIAAVDLGPSAALDSLVKELDNLGAAALPLSGDMATADAPGRVVTEAIAPGVSIRWRSMLTRTGSPATLPGAM